MVEANRAKAAVAGIALGIGTFLVLLLLGRGKFHLIQVVGGGVVGGAYIKLRAVE